ncbi:ornithine carbamoyltransferase [Nowakowskiella sp. JEL0407]|nr:ornithine carbamoyltransferase [Nowakowskiella sp. JEL0407]
MIKSFRAPTLPIIFRFNVESRNFSTTSFNASIRPTFQLPSFKGHSHFLTLRDFSPAQILYLVRRSLELEQLLKNPSTSVDIPERKMLSGKTLAMIFAKRSTRTRVSSESGWAYFGGHPMFLSKEDIQIGGGEALKDTSIVISSMVDCILARVGEHSEITELAENSSVPVINALTAKFHPLQILADLMTMYQVYHPDALTQQPPSGLPLPLLPNLKVAWVGDANNIINSMLVTFPRIGISLSVATPEKYDIDQDIVEYAEKNSGNAGQGKVEFTHDAGIAVKDADVIVTDTWVSMGQESEKEKKLRDFKGYQVTEQMAKDGGAKSDWKFMHCLPRKKEEVDDEVFYGKRSIVFPEAENPYSLIADKEPKYDVQSIADKEPNWSTEGRQGEQTSSPEENDSGKKVRKDPQSRDEFFRLLGPSQQQMIPSPETKVPVTKAPTLAQGAG